MPQSWYKPAAWVQGSGWVCKRQRIRQKRPFEEKDLVRMVCKKYQDGVINPDTFYVALLDCGLNDGFLKVFEALPIEHQRFFMQNVLLGKTSADNVIGYFDKYDSQLELLNIIFNDERSRFYQQRGGFCAIADSINWLNTNASTISVFLISLAGVLAILGVLFPVSSPWVLWALGIAGVLLNFINGVIGGIGNTNNALQLMVGWFGCSGLSVESLGKPEDMPSVPTKPPDLPDFLP